MTTIEVFCHAFGIGKNRRVKSTKGRAGTVVCIEYAPNPEDGKVWIQIDGQPGNVRVPPSQFLKPLTLPANGKS